MCHFSVFSLQKPLEFCEFQLPQNLKTKTNNNLSMDNNSPKKSIEKQNKVPPTPIKTQNSGPIPSPEIRSRFHVVSAELNSS